MVYERDRAVHQHDGDERVDGEERGMEFYVGDLVGRVSRGGVDDEVGELERRSEDDGVVVGGCTRGGGESVGVVGVLGEVGYSGVEVGGDGGRGVEHAVEDAPIAAGDGVGAAGCHAHHGFESVYPSQVGGVVDTRAVAY